jgi:hypothetical protein
MEDIMKREDILKSILPKSVCMTPQGFLADELNPEQFTAIHKEFFKSILEIKDANIDGIVGYGELNEEGKTPYKSCREFMIGTFSEELEGYWHNWSDMFQTTMLEKDIFYRYYDKMEKRIDACEGKRYLYNGSMWFTSIVTDGKKVTGFPDWNRAGIGDFLLDFATMDLHKPYLKIPELLVAYCKEQGIEITNFKDRFLCMAYYRQIDTLRWHASIEDEESYVSIKKSLEELEDRIEAL